MDVNLRRLVSYKYPCYEIYIKTNIYLFLTTLYNSFITNIEPSPNYTAFDLSQTHQVR